MHTASYEFLIKPKESAGCHQTLSARVGSGDETSATGTLTTVVRRRAINSRAYASEPYFAAQMLNQLRRGHRAWPMFELKSGAAMAAPAAPMLPPLFSDLSVALR